MKKTKKSKSTLFECIDCGTRSSQWSGKCMQCGEWNSLVEVEEIESFSVVPSCTPQEIDNKIKSLSEIELKEHTRVKTGIREWDRVIGGGIVKGSVILLGGIPGIGKSTLLLQTAVALGEKGNKVLYVTAEESLNQIKTRSIRVGEADNVYLASESDLDVILECAKSLKPDFIILDSIQVIHSKRFNSSAGSVPQIRECTFELTRYAKSNGVSLFIVGHVTKDGALAGPKVLEHIVDTVIYFEGEDKLQYRMVRVQKNRFGPTDELGVFEMTGKGLQEIGNPSSLFLSAHEETSSGSVIVPVMEGSRIFFVELQALTVKSYSDYTKRTYNGVDPNRTNLILAILERRAKVKLYQTDVFLNVVGGVKVFEVAVDLGIAVSVISSANDITIASDLCVFGELGLSGEIRSVAKAEARVKEAKKLGFKKCILPVQSISQVKHIKDIQLIGVSNLPEVLQYLFSK